jgi:hypothetical protein
MNKEPEVFQDKREFFRIPYKAPLEFRSYPSDKAEKMARKDTVTPTKGLSENISSSGVLFQVEKTPPRLSSILWMNLDIRTLKICREIENRALIFNNGILGRVVRVEEDPQKVNLYNVGVCFLTQDEKTSREVEQIISGMAKL